MDSFSRHHSESHHECLTVINKYARSTSVAMLKFGVSNFTHNLRKSFRRFEEDHLLAIAAPNDTNGQ